MPHAGETRGTGGDDRVSSLDEVGLVIDADAHVQEDFETFTSFVDEKHRAAKKLIDAASLPSKEIYSTTVATPSFSYTGLEGGGKGLVDNINQASGVETLASAMAETNVDGSLITGTMNLGLPAVNNSRIAVALANAYNNWILHDLEEYGAEHMKGAILLAPQKPDRAAEEIDRLADEDLMGAVHLPATGLIPPPGHRWYDPLYEAIEDSGLPLVMHSATGAKGFPQQFFWSETYAMDHVYQHPFAHMYNLTSLMAEGIPERFPGIDFVFQEAGLGYVPYMMHRLDDHYWELGHEWPALKRPPSEYMADQFYFCSQPLGHTTRDPKHMAWMVEMIGPENVLFSADLPHPDFDTPGELFDRIRGHFDADTVRGIMGGTAADLFGLA